MAGPTKFNKLVDIQDVQAGLDATFGEMIRIAKKAGKVAEKEIKRTIKLIKELQRAGGVKSTKTDNKANTLINQMTVSINKLNAAKNTEIDIQKKQAAAAAKVLEAKKKNKEATKLLLEETNKIVLAYKKEREEIAGIDKQMTSWQVKINALKKDKAKLNTAIRKGTGDQVKNAQALQRIQVQLKKYTSKMREATNAQSGLTKAGLRFRDKMAGSLVRSFKTIGIAAAAAFGFRAIIRVFDNAIKIFRDFEQATANLGAVSGFTDQEMSKLTKQAKQLGATSSSTASQILELQTAFAKLGFPTSEILGMTEATQEASAAFGTDLGKTAEVVGATLRQFGLTAKDTRRVVDVMQNSFSGSALDLEKFSVAMRNVAPTAKAAGLSIEETTARLGILTSSGVDASSAGSSLRNILLSLAKTGKPLKKALDEINEATNKNAVAVELFGKKGATSAIILAEQQVAVDKLAESLKKSGTVQAAAAKQLDTLEGQQKLTASAYEGMILSVEDGDGAISKALKRWEGLKQGLFSFLTVQEKESEALFKQKVNLNVLTGAVIQAEKGTVKRTEAIAKLQAAYPDFLKNLDAETASNEDLSEALDKVNLAFDEQIKLRALQEVAQAREDEALSTATANEAERQSLIFDVTDALNKQGTSTTDINGNLEELVRRYNETAGKNRLLGESLGKTADLMFGLGSVMGTVNTRFDELTRQEGLLVTQTEEAERALGTLNESGLKNQDIFKSVADQLHNVFVPLSHVTGLMATIFVPDVVEKIQEQEKKASKARSAARKKARDEEKKELEARIRLQREIQRRLEDIVINSIEDTDERRIAQIEISADRELEDAKATGEELRLLRTAIELETINEIADIRKAARERETEEARAAILSDQEKLNKLIQDGLDKDVKEIEDAEKAKQKAMRETLKLATELSDEFFEKRDKQLSDDIDASKKRESELIALAEKGSLRDNESIAAERKKQAELEAERKRAEQAKLALQALGIVLSTYQSKIEADDPTPVKSTAKDLLTLKALAGTLIGLAEGTDYVDGKGMYKVHSGLDGYLANLNHGEMVFTDGQRKDMGGISRDEVVDRVKHPGMYLTHPPEPILTTQDLALVNQGVDNKKEFAALQTEVVNMKNAINKGFHNMPIMAQWVEKGNVSDYLLTQLTKGGSIELTRRALPGRHGRNQG